MGRHQIVHRDELRLCCWSVRCLLLNAGELEERIDERSNSRSLRENNQST